MINFRGFLTFCLILFLSSHLPLSGQIVFKQLPHYEFKISDSLFFDITATRKVIPLNGKWNVYSSGDKRKEGTSVSVPSVFSGEGELIFEKNFSLTRNEIKNYKAKVVFLGLNYSAEISLNNIIIFRHSGGEYPFQVELPGDVLTADQQNVLKVKLTYIIDSETTIPVKQRFLFPQSFGGIFRDVYIHLVPAVSISEISISKKYSERNNSLSLGFHARIDKKFSGLLDSIPLRFTASLISPYENIKPQIIEEKGIIPGAGKDKRIEKTFNIINPVLWRPANPAVYKLYMELYDGDYLIDRTVKEIGFFSLIPASDSLNLNGNSFEIQGVTYVPSNMIYGGMLSYGDMERDISLIKNTGFNCVRFINTVPHPYYLSLCGRYGLLAFIEIPANAIPGPLIEDINFIERSRNYLNGFLKAYEQYFAVAAIGLGSSVPPASEDHLNTLQTLSSIVKKDSALLTYASFSSMDINAVEGIDLYGVEIINKSPLESAKKFEQIISDFGAGKVFISSATYIVNSGSSDGYLNAHTFEAQAKFFDDLMNVAEQTDFAGYFINTMFDYRGDFSSLAAGFNGSNIYHIGIANENRGTERIAYNVLNARLKNLEKVTIPIGSKKDDAPMIFIVFGLVTALMIGVLVNSGRKFREDASRALTRPYNFYADVRDQRIMSGMHTTFLAFVISAVSALLLSNLLFYLKGKLVFEKILLAFGSEKLLSILTYLSWSPLFSLLWLLIASAGFLLLLTLVVKFASFFVRTRVYLSSVYYTVTWSFLPLVLLIPLGIVLFRVLEAESINIYIYAGLLLFTLWIFYRLMKGIYVIFDVNPGSVYFYSLLIIFLVIGGFLFYYELNNSVIDYLILTINQHNTGG